MYSKPSISRLETSWSSAAALPETHGTSAQSHTHWQIIRDFKGHRNNLRNWTHRQIIGNSKSFFPYYYKLCKVITITLLLLVTRKILNDLRTKTENVFMGDIRKKKRQSQEKDGVIFSTDRPMLSVRRRLLLANNVRPNSSGEAEWRKEKQPFSLYLSVCRISSLINDPRLAQWANVDSCGQRVVD